MLGGNAQSTLSEYAGRPELKAAIAQSFLAELSPELVTMLMDGSHLVQMPAGAVFYEREDRPTWALLVTGLIRTYVRSPDGRQLTVRYFRQGDVLGYATVFGGSVRVSAQTVSRAQMLFMDPRDLRTLVRQEDAAWVLLREMAGRLNDLISELEASAFGTVKQRLARHLLDLAVIRGPELIVEMSHQELADSVGSVREVVQRALRALSRAEMVRTAPSSVVILDAERLFAAARPRVRRD
jgi:CRP/FNR family transcriptional regulator, cyclic AMP receptor protein